MPPTVLENAFSLITLASQVGIIEHGNEFVLDDGIQVKTFADVLPYIEQCLKERGPVSGARGQMGRWQVTAETFNPALAAARRAEAYLIEPNPPKQPRLGLIFDLKLYRVSENDWVEIVMPLEAYVVDKVVVSPGATD